MRRRDVHRAIARLAAAFVLPGCGYAPVHTSAPTGGGRLHVQLVRSVVADAIAAGEVAQGVREELARFGALEPGEGFPVLEIEVVRADEASDGLRVGSAGGPAARATAIAMVARGWVVPRAGAEPERDSGDLRAETTLAVDEVGGAPDPRGGLFHAADAARAAARRVGARIARRILGLPAASEPLPGGP